VQGRHHDRPERRDDHEVQNYGELQKSQNADHDLLVARKLDTSWAACYGLIHGPLRQLSLRAMLAAMMLRAVGCDFLPLGR